MIWQNQGTSVLKLWFSKPQTTHNLTGIYLKTGFSPTKNLKTANGHATETSYAVASLIIVSNSPILDSNTHWPYSITSWPHPQSADIQTNGTWSNMTGISRGLHIVLSRGLHQHILTRKEENGHFLCRPKHIISLTYNGTWVEARRGLFNPTTFLPSLWQDDKACDGPISTPKHDLLERNPTGGPRDKPDPSGQTMPRRLGVGRV